MCKSCCKEYGRSYRKNNLTKIKTFQKNWYKNNKNKAKAIRESYVKSNPEKLKETRKKYRDKNQEIMKLKRKAYCEKNRIRLNEYTVKLRRSDPLNKIKHNIRGRICKFLSIRNISKTNKTFDIVGCSPNELKIHLEKQFDNGMSWENYGYYGWHIDHIIPLDSGKNEKEIYELCHYSNLQPLWCNDNQSKSNKIK